MKKIVKKALMVCLCFTSLLFTGCGDKSNKLKKQDTCFKNSQLCENIEMAGLKTVVSSEEDFKKMLASAALDFVAMYKYFSPSTSPEENSRAIAAAETPEQIKEQINTYIKKLQKSFMGFYEEFKKSNPDFVISEDISEEELQLLLENLNPVFKFSFTDEINIKNFTFLKYIFEQISELPENISAINDFIKVDKIKYLDDIFIDLDINEIQKNETSEFASKTAVKINSASETNISIKSVEKILKAILNIDYVSCPIKGIGFSNIACVDIKATNGEIKSYLNLADETENDAKDKSELPALSKYKINGTQEIDVALCTSSGLGGIFSIKLNEDFTKPEELTDYTNMKVHISCADGTYECWSKDYTIEELMNLTFVR